MKRVLALLIVLPLGMVAAAAVPARAADRADLAYGENGLSPFQLSVFDGEAFQRDFMQSYRPLTELEPEIPDDEKPTLLEALRLAGLVSREEGDRRRSRDRQDEQPKSKLQQLDEAIAYLKDNIDPTSGAAMHFTLGNLYFQKSFAEGLTSQEKEDAAANAVDAYRRAVDEEDGFPRYRRAWDNMAKLYVQYGRHAEAVECLTEVIRLGGRDGVTFGLLGFSYGNLGRDIAAESAYRQAIMLDDETMDWKLGLARSMFKQQRYGAAAAFTDTLIKTSPENADFWLLQANAYIGMQKPVEAAYNYEFVDTLGESTVDSLNTLGDIYINEGLFELAVESYGRALAMQEKGGLDRALRAAKVLAARGAHDAVELMVQQIREHREGNLEDQERKEMLKLEARVAVARGNEEQEIEVLEQIVEIDPLDGEALMLLGQYHRRNKDLEQAMLYYQQAESIEEFEADAKVRQAQVLVSQGKYNQAVSLLKSAQRINYRETIQEYLEQVERVSKSG